MLRVVKTRENEGLIKNTNFSVSYVIEIIDAERCIARTWVSAAPPGRSGSPAKHSASRENLQVNAPDCRSRASGS